MIKKFNQYLERYDLNDPDIKLKYDHSIRVMNLMVKYATLLEYSEDDIELAKIIGLLHDIGRFEQLRVYHTYSDQKSVDHADYSVEQLFGKGEIKLFTSREEWYPIIEFAIKNHNKRLVPITDDEKSIRFANLIRDIDKLDILYLMGVLEEFSYEDTTGSISDEVKEYVYNHETVDTTKCQNNVDAIVCKFAFVFDINNDEVLEEYKKYFDAYYERVDKDKFKEMYDVVTSYLNEVINSRKLKKIERND